MVYIGVNLDKHITPQKPRHDIDELALRSRRETSYVIAELLEDRETNSESVNE